MGAANLALAREALKEELAAKPEDAARMRIAVAKASAALRRHAQWMLSTQGVRSGIGHFPYYRLYALEKACIFLDLEDVGGIRWYQEGARWLLDEQAGKHGGWAGARAPERTEKKGWFAQPNAQDTSFALLFLLRASAAYHPVTPRPIDRPKVTTPSGGPAPKDDGKQAAPTAPPLTLARGAVERLEQALALPRLTTLRPLTDALRLVGRVYASSRTKDGFVSPGHEIWARRVDDVILKLAVRFRLAKANDRLLWQAVALEALDTLPRLHPRIAPRAMRAIESLKRDVSFPAAYRIGWYGSAMEALRRLDPPGLATWLGERILSADPKLWWRTSPALTALGGMAPKLSGRARHGIMRSMWRQLVGFTRRSAGHHVMADLMRDMLVLMHRLAAVQGKDAQLPNLGMLEPAETLKRLRSWWAQHKEPDDPLWR